MRARYCPRCASNQITRRKSKPGFKCGDCSWKGRYPETEPPKVCSVLTMSTFESSSDSPRGRNEESPGYYRHSARQGRLKWKHATDIQHTLVVAYWLIAVGIFTGGLLSIFGLSMARSERDQAEGTIYSSHIENITTAFGIQIGTMILTILCIVISGGWSVFFGILAVLCFIGMLGTIFPDGLSRLRQRKEAHLS